MEVESVESIPLAHSLGEGRGYGSARGTFDQRQTVLVRVETTDGTVGWGETSYGPPETIATLVDEVLADVVVGSSPWEVRSLAERMYTGAYHFARGSVFNTAVAGVDIALWDVVGKAVGESVATLLGGPRRSEVTPYASTMYVTEWGQDPAEPIEAAVDEGFRAAKIKIGRGLDEDVARVATARERLGDDAYLMADVNGNYHPEQAIRTIRALEPYDLHWIEEPVPPENRSGYHDVKRRVDVPLAAGEAAFTRFDFKPLVDERAVDVVQPDVCKLGFTEGMLVADLATTENVSVLPHVWYSPVGVAASLQFAAALPTYPHSTSEPDEFLFEYDRGPNPMRTDLADEPFDPTGGSLAVPDDPGLGVTVDEDALEAYRID